MSIVVFGGTFSPFHCGHLRLIESLKNELNPERIILVPSGVHPRKTEDVLSAADRLEICRIAADLSGAVLSDFEMNTPGKSYTVDTLEHFHGLYPGKELYFAMGSDMLRSFPGWYRADRILELCSLAVSCRSESERLLIKDDVEKIASMGGRCVLLNEPALACSSTDIRRRIREEKPTDGLLPEPVLEYIKRKGLYRD